MITHYMDSYHSKKIGLLGPSFDTANRGVSALTEGSIKCMLSRWPDAEFTLLAGGRESVEYTLEVLDKEIYVKTLPIRFCKNIFIQNHFCVLVWYGLILKLLPSRNLRERFIFRRTPLKRISELDFVADITAGDSFSDIYGLPKFLWIFLLKWLALFFGKDLVMLPQTYGPYHKSITRVLARYIIKRAKFVYSRDKEGLDTLKKLLGKDYNCNKIKFSPDVAFVLDPREPQDVQIEPCNPHHSCNDKGLLVGLNISGLLFNGGYTRDNMFGLNADYPRLISNIVRWFMEQNCHVLLIPHVFAPAGNVESDPDACLHVYHDLKAKFKSRLFLLQGEYDHNEIKYIIGLCDFFIGSRMHACIAALSQNIPTVGIAYSRKFIGVFGSVGVAECVADAKHLSNEGIMKTVESNFMKRQHIKEHLVNIMPEVEKQVLGFIHHINR